MAIRILGDLDLQEAVSALGDLPDLKTGYCVLCGRRCAPEERHRAGDDADQAPPGPPVRARA